MYTEADLHRADQSVKRRTLALLLLLLILLAGYVAAILAGREALMLVLLLCGFWIVAPVAVLWLLPVAKYRRFLKEMADGLRRECRCTLDSISQEIALQDGVRVHALQVRLEDGDTRLFYVNASKADLLPPMETQLILLSWGRHLVDWRKYEC